MGTWVRDCEARLIQCRQPITVCIQSARKPHHPHVYHQSRQEILRLWKHWICIGIYMMMETINQNILLAPWPSTLEVLYKHCIQCWKGSNEQNGICSPSPPILHSWYTNTIHTIAVCQESFLLCTHTQSVS